MRSLDKAYFESVLQEPVDSIEVKAGAQAGDNMAGSLKSVKLTTSSGSIHNFVVKTHPAAEAWHSGMLEMKMMLHEQEFYAVLLPNMATYFNAAIGALGKSSTAHPAHEYLRFPRYIAGNFEYLILEDVRPSGYKMASKFETLDSAHVHLVLTAMARLHAIGYAYIRHEGMKVFDSLETKSTYFTHPWYNSPNPEDPPHTGLNGVFGKSNEVIRELHSAELADKLDAYVPKFVEVAQSMHNKTFTDYFATVVHCDMWTNNVMFKYDDQGQPQDVTIIDLQQVKAGNVFEDLLYFFYTSTTAQWREKDLLPALAVYFEAFEKTLKKLRVPMPVGFTLGFFIDHYFSNIFGFSVFAGIAIAMQLGKMDFEDPAEAGKEKAPDPDDAVVLPDPPTATFNPDDYWKFLEFVVYFNLKNDPRPQTKFLDTVKESERLGVYENI